MGCSGSKKDAGQPPASPESTEKVADLTWATKIDNGIRSPDESWGGAQPTPARKDFILQDAEDDDEIEFIQEDPPGIRGSVPRLGRGGVPLGGLSTSGSQLQWTSAANSQEPPEALESPISVANGNGKQPEVGPLTKQQQDEAAKLADARARFEARQQSMKQQHPNGQHELTSAVTWAEPTKDLVVDSPKEKRAFVRAGTGWAGPKSSDTLLMSLTSGQTSQEKQKSKITGFGMQPGLPGGILEDEDMLLLEGAPSSTSGQHSNANLSDFDADDEQLMKEILDNYDS